MSMFQEATITNVLQLLVGKLSCQVIQVSETDNVLVIQPKNGQHSHEAFVEQFFDELCLVLDRDNLSDTYLVEQKTFNFVLCIRIVKGMQT